MIWCIYYSHSESTAPMLQLPPVKTAFAARAFTVAAPKLWNSLSARTRSANTSATFRSILKTELFFDCLLLGRFNWTQRIRFACDNCALQIVYVMLCYVCNTESYSTLHTCLVFGNIFCHLVKKDTPFALVSMLPWASVYLKLRVCT